jgi:hypothetical protein
MNIKKIAYILLAMFLGLLFSLIAHALIEINFLNNSFVAGNFSEGRGCFLPLTVQIILPISGLAFGYYLGVNWWQIVYVEKRHWRMKKRGKRKMKKWDFKY